MFWPRLYSTSAHKSPHAQRTRPKRTLYNVYSYIGTILHNVKPGFWPYSGVGVIFHFFKHRHAQRAGQYLFVTVPCYKNPLSNPLKSHPRSLESNSNSTFPNPRKTLYLRHFPILSSTIQILLNPIIPIPSKILSHSPLFHVHSLSFLNDLPIFQSIKLLFCPVF